MLDDLKKDAAARMAKCVQTFQADVKKLRTGRAHPSLVEHLKVDYYGTDVPLSQVSNITIEDARTIAITPWEKTMVQVIEKAIHKSDLGLTPMTAGAVIRVPLPPLTTERRNELAKAAARYAEGTRVAIRGVRRDGMEQVKGWDKKHEVSEDEAKQAEVEIQKLTDQYVKQVDATLVEKEKDIRTV